MNNTIRLSLAALIAAAAPTITHVAGKNAIKGSELKFIGQGGKLCISPMNRISANVVSVDPHNLDCRSPSFIEFSGYPPRISPFGDSEYYVLTDVMAYKLGPNNDQLISIPKGFVTDLASVPKKLRGWFPHDGPYMSAAIVHDYMYWDQRCTKDQADRILDREMRKFGVSDGDAWKIYHAVQWFGKKAWAQDAKDKKTKIQVVPEPYLDQYLNRDMTASSTWENLQKELKANGVMAAPDPGNPNIAAICVAAGSSKIGSEQ